MSANKDISNQNACTCGCRSSPIIRIVKSVQTSSPSSSERRAMASNRIDLLTASNSDLDLGYDNPGQEVTSSEVPNMSRRGSADSINLNINRRSAVVQFVVPDDEDSEEVETGPWKKCKENRHSRSILLSALYAIMLIMVGFIFPVTEALRDVWITNNVVGIFLVYLYIPSMIFLIYVQVYHVHGSRKENTEAEPTVEGTDFQQNQKNGQSDLVLTAVRRGSAVSLASIGINPVQSGSELQPPANQQDTDSSSNSGTGPLGYEEEEEMHEYVALRTGTATFSHEGASFYLRLGCLLFAIGNMIFICLKIEFEFGFNHLPECKTDKVQYPIFFRLGFTVVQTFFLFKNCTLVITKHKHLVRFGLMHVLATNMCIWLRVLVEEVMHGIHEHPYIRNHEVPDAIVETYNHESLEEPFDDANHTGPCGDPSTSLLSIASPYLFPFVLEYSLIAVAAMASMYHALGIHVSRDILEAVRTALRHARKKTEKLTRGLHHSPFHKSHFGTFLGMVVCTGVMVTLVLFYYFQSMDDDDNYRADLTFQIMDIILNSIMMLACIVGMVKLYPLGFDLKRDNSIDHNLLVLSMMGFIVLEAFILVSAFASIEHDNSELDTLHIVNGIAGIIAAAQGLIQTIFIIDGMQRFCINKDQLNDKPGRGTVTFLIVANVAGWIFKSFGEKELSVQSESKFYGDIAWPLILNISMPLLLFFRFHSSICLAHMWHSAYKEEDNIFDDKDLV